jgi:hypothetical protein
MNLPLGLIGEESKKRCKLLVLSFVVIIQAGTLPLALLSRGKPFVFIFTAGCGELKEVVTATTIKHQ